MSYDPKLYRIPKPQSELEKARIRRQAGIRLGEDDILFMLERMKNPCAGLFGPPPLPPGFCRPMFRPMPPPH